MSLEIIDVIDSAVKIGLGALISGVTTYSVTKFKHKSDIDKYLFNKKYETVEEIALLAEEYFHSFYVFNNNIAGIQKRATNINEELTVDQIKQIHDSSDDPKKITEYFK